MDWNIPLPLERGGRLRTLKKCMGLTEYPEVTEAVDNGGRGGTTAYKDTTFIGPYLYQVGSLGNAAIHVVHPCSCRSPFIHDPVSSPQKLSGSQSQT